ncbi:MAG: tripartite tricarboxylate transporter TctB family protein [Kineosporiaceae bacterium]
MTGTDPAAVPPPGPAAEQARRRETGADLAAGGVFVVLGVGFAAGAQRYDLGSALQMGPGYIPTVLGGTLAVLGLLVLGQGVLAARRGGASSPGGARPPGDGATAAPDDAAHAGEPLPGDEHGPVPWWRLALLAGVVALFGLVVDGLGLVGTLVVCGVLAALAGRRPSLLRALVIGTTVTVLCLVVFVGALQLRLPLVGPWLGG